MSISVSAPEKWVSLKAAAEHFDLSEKTLRRMIADRGIPARRFGGRTRGAIRVQLSEIEKAAFPMGALSR